MRKKTKNILIILVVAALGVSLYFIFRKPKTDAPELPGAAGGGGDIPADSGGAEDAYQRAISVINKEKSN